MSAPASALNACPSLASAYLERHTSAAAHGDVCRLSDGSGYYCPSGCSQIPRPPFCVVMSLGPPIACRVADDNQVASELRSDYDTGKRYNDYGDSDEEKSNGSNEDAGEKYGVCYSPKFEAIVERHTKQANHGDICRMMDPTSGASLSGFFCPRGCVSSSKAPFCLEKPAPGEPSTVCRVADDLTDEHEDESSGGESSGDNVEASSGSNEDAGETRGVCYSPKFKAIVERHTKQANHGDICRMMDPTSGASLGGFFCPRGCVSLTSAPFCQAEPAPGELPTVCRVRTDMTYEQDGESGRENDSGSTQEGSIDNSLAKSQDVCFSSASPTFVERHPGSLRHGDICRFEDTSLGFFCPRGCTQIARPPFCHAAGRRSVVCRVAAPTLSSLIASAPPHLAAAAEVVPRPEGAAWCDGSDDPGRRPFALLEHHTSSAHGDVCREPGDPFGWYFCPFGCANVGAAPHCAAPTNAIVPTVAVDEHSPFLPCRIASPQNAAAFAAPSTTLAATQALPAPNNGGKHSAARPAGVIESVSASVGVGGGPRLGSATEPCDLSDDPERRDGAVLERHTLEQGHGDVCRNAPDYALLDEAGGLFFGPSADDFQPAAATFFCPLGCARSNVAPYCSTSSSLGGTQGAPCRAPLVVVSEVERLSVRLRELEATRMRAKGDGNLALVRQVLSQHMRSRQGAWALALHTSSLCELPQEGCISLSYGAVLSTKLFSPTPLGDMEMHVRYSGGVADETCEV